MLHIVFGLLLPQLWMVSHVAEFAGYLLECLHLWRVPADFQIWNSDFDGIKFCSPDWFHCSPWLLLCHEPSRGVMEWWLNQKEKWSLRTLGLGRALSEPQETAKPAKVCEQESTGLDPGEGLMGSQESVLLSLSLSLPSEVGDPITSEELQFPHPSILCFYAQKH